MFFKLDADKNTVLMQLPFGQTGIILLSFRNDRPNTEQFISRFTKDHLKFYCELPTYSPGINDPQIALMCKQGNLKFHDSLTSMGSRVPAVIVMPDDHFPENHLSCYHFWNGKPSNYNGVHSYHTGEQGPLERITPDVDYAKNFDTKTLRYLDGKPRDRKDIYSYFSQANRVITQSKKLSDRGLVELPLVERRLYQMNMFN